MEQDQKQENTQISPKQTSSPTIEKCPDCGIEGTQLGSMGYNRWIFDCNCKEQRALKEMEIKKQAEISEREKDIFLNIERILTLRGVPKRYLSASLSDFGKFKMPEDRGLYLTGTRGTGKTHLACAIIKNHILENFMEAKKDMPMFVSIPDLLLEIRDSFGKTPVDKSWQGGEVIRSEKTIIDFYSKLPLLVMDDLGIEKTSEWSIQTLYTIIDKRYREMKRTIFTSNLSLEEIAQKLDDRISSRIAGMCSIHTMKGKDRRLG